MGFRNPITSASDVDTGMGAADPGVRVYQRVAGGVPQGVVEWRTGLMDRNATATLAGGGSGGSSYVIDGGATQGISAPQIDLNVESLAGGGYGPKARITAPYEPIQAGTVIPAAGWSGTVNVVQDAAGNVYVNGIMNNVSAGTVTNPVIGTLPSWARPSGQSIVDAMAWTATANDLLCRADVNNNGTIQIQDVTIPNGKFVNIHTHYRLDS